MNGSHWNRVPSVYWWCDCWYKLQNEFWSVKDNTLYLEYAANAAKKKNFTVEMDNDSKHSTKPTQEFLKAKKGDIIQ